MAKTTNIIVRLNSNIHKGLVKLAKERHQSLNGLINSVMESELKKDQKKMVKNLD